MFEINWAWLGLVVGTAFVVMLIEEYLNRKGFEPDFMPLYAMIGSFAIFAFF